MLIRNVADKLKVWDILDIAQKVFPTIKMSQVESEFFFKLSKLYARKVQVLLDSSLYRALKQSVLSWTDELSLI